MIEQNQRLCLLIGLFSCSTASDPAEALSSSIIAAAGGLVPETATERRHRRTIQRRQRNKGTSERCPKLTVLSINHDGSGSDKVPGGSSPSGSRGPIVECQLETTRNKTVTFKFDCADYVPGDIANNLVSICHVQYILSFKFPD